MYIPFSQWLPDQFDLNNPGLEEAKNCLPGKDGFRGFPSFVRKSTNTIDGTARGLYSTKDGQGSAFIFVGDDNKLYRYTSAQAFENVSKAGNYANANSWEFTIFNQTVIATNYVDDPQAYTIGTDALYRDLGGSPPKARFTATVRDFVLLADVVDQDGDQPTRVWRSPRNSPEGPWTPNAKNQCGFADIPDSGPITGLSGGAFGIALTQAGVHRLTYVGSPQVFQRDEIGNGVGCEFPGSVVRRIDARGILATLFFLGNDGFYISDGSTVRQIANDRINEWLFANLDEEKKSQIRAGIYPTADCVIWSFPSTTNPNANGKNDKYVAFSYSTNAWAYGDLDVDELGLTSSAATLLDDIDELVDNITDLVDSAIWDGGDNRFGAIDHEGYFGTFTGPNLTPLFATGDIRPISSRRSRLGQIYLDMDGVASTQVRSGETPSNMGAYGPTQTIRRGFTSHRVDCKSNNIHSVRVNGGEAFTYAKGIECEVIPGGN